MVKWGRKIIIKTLLLLNYNVAHQLLDYLSNYPRAYQKLIRVDQTLQHKSNEKYKKTLIIFRTDAIGDYILFRNFLAFIRKSEKFQSYKIVFVGDSAYKDIAQKYDNSYIDQFIWFSNKKVERDEYALLLSNTMAKEKAKYLFYPIFSRVAIYDKIIQRSNTQKKIAPANDFINNKSNIENLAIDSLISCPNYSTFEFSRNKYLISQFLEQEIEIRKPQLPVLSEKQLHKPYVVLFIGSSNPKLRWNPINYAELAIYITEKYKYDVYITGGKSEIIDADALMKQVSDTRIKNLVGTTNLIQLINLIQSAKFLVSNETSAVHIAASTDTRFFCISNGNHIKRFNPYPQDVFLGGVYIYPPQIKQEIAQGIDVCEKYKHFSPIDINTISIDTVIQEINSSF